MIYIGILLLIVSGFAKSVSDRLADGKWDFYEQDNRWFGYKIETWRNKYKDGDPQKGEKFLFSTTLLVFLTDAWHFFQLLMFITLILGASIITNLLIISFGFNINIYLYSLILTIGIFLFVFQLFYDYKVIISILKKPWIMLSLLVLYGIIAGLFWGFSDSEFILTSIKYSIVGIIGIGGISAVAGFIYGIIAWLKSK